MILRSDAAIADTPLSAIDADAAFSRYADITPIRFTPPPPLSALMFSPCRYKRVTLMICYAVDAGAIHDMQDMLRGERYASPLIAVIRRRYAADAASHMALRDMMPLRAICYVQQAIRRMASPGHNVVEYGIMAGHVGACAAPKAPLRSRQPRHGTMMLRCHDITTTRRRRHYYCLLATLSFCHAIDAAATSRDELRWLR